MVAAIEPPRWKIVSSFWRAATESEYPATIDAVRLLQAFFCGS